MSQTGLKRLIGAAVVERDFCGEAPRGEGRLTRLRSIAPGREQRTLTPLDGVRTDDEDVCQLLRWMAEGLDLTARFPFAEELLVESLAWGLLDACGVDEHPVPIMEMIESSHHIFERLTLLPVNIGLWGAAYRSGLGDTHFIAVDVDYPVCAQRLGAAKALYAAFCCSHRAQEVAWPHRERPYIRADFFARCLLMPTPWIERACSRSTSVREVAALFGVSVEAAMQRLVDLGAERLFGTLQGSADGQQTLVWHSETSTA